MGNSYADMITQVCVDVIPGYEPFTRVIIEGEYKQDNSPRTINTPEVKVTLKINFGGTNDGTSNA